MLTAYNGVTRTHDEIGNLLSDGTWTYTWQHGRELASMSSGTTTWSYTYDGNGMRISRTNGTKTYNYVYNGSQLVQMSVGSDTLYFTYGLLGPTTVTWNGTTYYYALNGQGDVIGIFDEDGNLVVAYNWDNAWGYNPLPSGVLADTIGTLNPLRYRGYVYDTETGLYYLQSRYYNPEIGRFINADSIVSGSDGNIRGYNLFAYCFNNPVNMSDPSGHWWQWIKSAVKWVATNVVKPVIKAVQNTLSKVNLTYSTGISASISPSALIFNGQIGMSIDTKGNVAIQASGGGGVVAGEPGGSITNYHSITNAPTIDKLNGEYYQVGASTGGSIGYVPVSAGGDIMYMPDSELNTGYHGLTGNIGLGSPGKELHFECGTTTTLANTYFNVYDVARSIYIKIMEW